MTLDNPDYVRALIMNARDGIAKAHQAATEDGGLSGPVRDFLFGIGTTIDAALDLMATP